MDVSQDLTKICKLVSNDSLKTKLMELSNTDRENVIEDIQSVSKKIDKYHENGILLLDTDIFGDSPLTFVGTDLSDERIHKLDSELDTLKKEIIWGIIKIISHIKVDSSDLH